MQHNTTQQETLCLDKGRSYSFDIRDSHGDGLGDRTVNAGGLMMTQQGGFYSLRLDGTEIHRGSHMRSVEIQTEPDPDTPAPTPSVSRVRCVVLYFVVRCCAVMCCVVLCHEQKVECKLKQTSGNFGRSRVESS